MPSIIHPVESSPYPVREGNAVLPLIDGVPAFQRICEAIEAATCRVWVTVTFMWPEFQMPDGYGDALDVLDSAAARGVDVRVVFWRPDGDTEHWKRNAFWGSEEHIQQLTERESGISIRWDRAATGFCQHQKSWLVDDVAFVGGINLNPNSVVEPGHRGGANQNHDAYVELRGPATTDVAHNFAERWNQATERHKPDGVWGPKGELHLPYPGPSENPLSVGDVRVQIQRTRHGKEQSILEQYYGAILSAQHSIYIENQYMVLWELADRMLHAVQRGVELVMLLPAAPDTHFPSVLNAQPHFAETWKKLSSFENFTLVGIYGLNQEGQRTPVYVHSKLMVVDDAFATVGSANLHRYSLTGNAELNVSFWSEQAAKRLRVELFQEHLGRDTSTLDDRAALREFRRIAQENRERHHAGDTDWQGLACLLDPAIYGR